MQTVQQAHWINSHPDKEQLFYETRAARSVSRRDFVRLLGAAGFATAVGGIPGSNLAREKKTGARISGGSVAILGAGVAGLTAAYRLQKACVPCEIFEASGRTGGRMFTKRNFNSDRMFCELGGELVDSDHADLIQLAAELGVEIQELKGNDKGVDLYYFGGKHYQDEELIPAFQSFAARLAADQGTLYDKDQQLIPERAEHFDRLSLAEYLAAAGKGVDQWVIDLLRVAYVIEYGRDSDEQSALNLITYLEPETKDGFKLYGSSDESKRIKGGSGTLPDALTRALDGKVKINRGFRLVKLGNGNGVIALTFSTDDGTRTLKFERAICTLPFTMLRLVEGVDRLPISPAKKRSIAHLGYGYNVKLMLGFTERWWRNLELHLPGPSNGSIFTDLPLQATWETSRGQEGSRGVLTNFMGGSTGKNFAPARIDKVKEELNRIFPGIKDKFDGNRAVMNWPVYQYVKGSYTCPLVGQFTTLLESAGTAEVDGQLLFAGEHTSPDFSGFMNGGIQSGNRAAQEIIAPFKAKLPKAA
ncbi:MAG: NAD(P)/FAD-dependent oxidoreductase [Verrucomicrobiota bacterium]|nr:NAD(P)/FAD-dependent oxidoreductase [Verrucomicrobiota bacterium]